MKANILMKIAVVFMAAFGAYAFSGSSKSMDLYPFSIKVDGQVCTNVLAGCSDSGNFDCKIQISGLPTVFDLDCNRVIKHENSDFVAWTPINP